MAAQKGGPLARLGDGRGAVQNLQDGAPIGAGQGQKDARHERKVKVHVELVAVAQVGSHVFGPLVGLGEQHRPRRIVVDKGPQALEVGVGLEQVLAIGAVALVEIGHGIHAKAVHALVQPEADHVQHLLLDGGMVVVQIRLVVEEAVPIIRAPHRVPAPIGGLIVEKDDARLGVALVGRTPDVPVPVFGMLGMVRVAGSLEPGALVGGVVGDQIGDDPQAAPVGFFHQGAQVVHRAIVGMDAVEIAHIVPVVAQRRGIDGQHPQAVDAQVAQVVELRGQAGQVADAIATAVGKGADEYFVEYGILVPVNGHGSTFRSWILSNAAGMTMSARASWLVMIWCSRSSTSWIKGSHLSRARCMRASSVWR